MDQRGQKKILRCWMHTGCFNHPLMLILKQILMQWEVRFTRHWLRNHYWICLKRVYFRVPNQSGKAIRSTRETVKSTEIVDLILIEGTKYPVFLSYSSIDEEVVAAYNAGESEDGSPKTPG
ncbi:unnamed protein product [Cuscuta campestris]|uniref:Uncharacterized protein n=1 Tax=Cuscuta campestris TaxID=132261 RepID=A0A484NCZ6_9ASTE|nr:unnamed protein product [Cuscuta campestris]